ALEKDRARRYATASDFAADVQRYLADEPVQACPPSLGYRLGKFLRRNRGPILAASLVLLVLVVGLIGTGWGMFQASDDAKEMDKTRGEAVIDRNKAKEAEKQAKKDRDEALDQRYAGVTTPISRLWRDGAHHEVRRQLELLRPVAGRD